VSHVRIIEGHVIEVLRGLAAESVHCVVTSPPSCDTVIAYAKEQRK